MGKIQPKVALCTPACPWPRAVSCAARLSIASLVGNRDGEVVETCGCFGARSVEAEPELGTAVGMAQPVAHQLPFFHELDGHLVTQAGAVPVPGPG